MLDNNIKNQLKSHFESLTQPVELLIALDDSKKSTEVESLANDLASLSDKFSVSNNPDTSARRPSMVVHSPQKTPILPLQGYLWVMNLLV
ncbi:alkyl hydroperoxide reductase subunit F [Pseudoalteromonas sp. BSi20439]|nr:alkyl hydroperoxide reductase subunit F [Pseudoalteromonas sp. BSi20439]